MQLPLKHLSGVCRKDSELSNNNSELSNTLLLGSVQKAQKGTKGHKRAQNVQKAQNCFVPN